MGKRDRKRERERERHHLVAADACATSKVKCPIKQNVTEVINPKSDGVVI